MSKHYQEPNFDVAQLLHVEILSPTPEETVTFFTRFLGLEVTEKSGNSTYLRAYEDTYKYSLIITEAEEAGLGHVAWRTSSPQALERRVKVVEQS